MKHAFVLVDRGPEHVHRWKPSCTCGTWTGAQRRRKQEALKQYRQHRVIVAPVTGRRKSTLKPRPPTPAELLPMALAPAVVSFS